MWVLHGPESRAVLVDLIFEPVLIQPQRQGEALEQVRCQFLHFLFKRAKELVNRMSVAQVAEARTSK